MKKRIVLGLLVLTTFTCIGFTGCKKKDQLTSLNNTKIENIKLPGAEDKEKYIRLDLYFDSTKDSKNVSVGKEERLLNKENIIGTLIMGELIKGPAGNGEFNSILPKDTKLISLTIKDDIAYVNLSQEVLKVEAGAKEKACLLAIAESLTQLDDVKRIQILIENKTVDSIGGKYDVSKPFGKDDIIERKK